MEDLETKNNEFCVNDKRTGSCWGKVITFDLLEKFITEGCKMLFEKRLYDWNGKVYIWFKDISADITGIYGDNYFIEIETD